MTLKMITCVACESKLCEDYPWEMTDEADYICMDCGDEYRRAKDTADSLGYKLVKKEGKK